MVAYEILYLLIAVVVVFVVVYYLVMWNNTQQPAPAPEVSQSINDGRKFMKTVAPYLNNLTNPIDVPVYYINLQRSQDRNKFMLKQLKKYSVTNYTRVDAIDGKHIEVEYINEFSNLTPSEIGCTLSHIKAIHQAYIDGKEYALILEDDCSFEFVPFWECPLSEFIDSLHQDWMIIQLQTLLWQTYRNAGICHQYTDTIYQPTTNIHGTTAYLINRRGMAEILRKCLVNNVHKILKKYSTGGAADEYIYCCVGNKRWVSNPSMFIPNNNLLSSTIHAEQDAIHIRFALTHVNQWCQIISQRLLQYDNLDLFKKLSEKKTVVKNPAAPTKYDIVCFGKPPTINLNPEEYRLFVYYKDSCEIPAGVHKYTKLCKSGAHSHSFIYHIVSYFHKPKSNYTVFLNGTDFKSINMIENFKALNFDTEEKDCLHWSQQFGLKTSPSCSSFIVKNHTTPVNLWIRLGLTLTYNNHNYMNTLWKELF